MRMPRFAAVAVVVVCTLLPLVAQTWIVGRAGFMMGDFHAFYCAARVAAHGADPYRTEPLRTCEIKSGLSFVYDKNHEVAVPAPLPAYTIAALVPFSVLPFTLAALLWAGLLLAALFICIVTLVKFAGVTWETALAAFALSVGVVSIPFGEIVPLALAAICAAAFFAWQGRWRASAVAAAVSMIEPHLGLPVCVALAVWAPVTRLPIGISFAVLGAVALAAVGLSTNVEYLSSVLPAHALSEAARDTQYSLTSVLAALGVNDVTAVHAGSLWYLGMLVAGTIVAGLLAKKTQNAAFLACVPPAFAVFGGTFIHISQIAAAIPATVLMLSYVQGKRRSIIALALLLLVVPWTWAALPSVSLALAFPIAYLAWKSWGRSARAAMIAAIAAGSLLIGLSMLYRDAVAQPVHIYAGTAIDNNLAEATWSAYTRRQSTNSFAVWAARIPTWTGLFLLLAFGPSSIVPVRLIDHKLDSEPEPA
ncbi:MAG: hypothetical protein ACXVAC_11705 [Vulcanimicrobiaceae bacterium]